MNKASIKLSFNKMVISKERAITAPPRPIPLENGAKYTHFKKHGLGQISRQNSCWCGAARRSISRTGLVKRGGEAWPWAPKDGGEGAIPESEVKEK